eukprot:TRINITY_DN2382_c1_g1_i4.p1 TRINITY_DN2382_c1_g1~~TRINITY_DN2382_c1_g1_i4.p1  ORF type:complete len:260 (-),score=20.60 TRINITY_DN2382_c1_g1_i4:379-1158(-)
MCTRMFRRKTFFIQQENKDTFNVPKEEELEDIDKLFYNNKKWASEVVKSDADYFKRVENGQSPQYLWLGCADSRVVVDQLLGLKPGDVFVHRNVGNLVQHTDMNAMSVLEYAVGALKVKHIIVCGHYGCGAVNASLTLPQKTSAMVNYWINDIRQTRDSYAEQLMKLPVEERLPRLCEYNVIRQTFNVVTSPVVQDAWAKGQDLTVHGFIYSLKDGLIKKIVGPIASNDGDVDSDENVKDTANNDALISNVMTHMSFES